MNVKVWGDEFYQRVESLDGYTLTRDEQTGWICYAQLASDERRFISTGVIYHNQMMYENFIGLSNKEQHPLNGIPPSLKLNATAIAAEKQATINALGSTKENAAAGQANKKASKTIGKIIGLTLLVDFSDQPATIAKQDIDDLMNKVGYTGYTNNGSVHDYYLEVSNGKLDYTNIVLGYYRAKKPKSYYDDNSSYGKVPELLDEVLTWADSLGFDFSTVSLNDQNAMIALNVFYAGSPSNGWAKGLWPHQWVYDKFKSNGIYSGKYELTNIGTNLSIGTICHENGHMLMDWPDLYDYGNDGTTSNGVGSYCLMAYGNASKNPVPPNAYLRADGGWDSVTTITKAGVYSHVANSNTSYRYNHIGVNGEFFMIESRLKTGRNTTLKDQGLMIWHIDTTVWGNEDQDMNFLEHYQVSLVQADGKFDLEKAVNYGNAGDLFKSGSTVVFNDDTTPNANWWNGEFSGIDLTNVSAPGVTMTFTLGTSPDGIKESETASFAQVFPNPCHQQFTLKLSNQPKNTALIIMDITGKSIQQKTVNAVNQTIDTSDIPAGVYLLQLQSDDKIYHYKLIKQ